MLGQKLHIDCQFSIEDIRAIQVLYHVYRIIIFTLFLGATIFAAHAVSPSNQFQQRLLELQRQGSCADLPQFGVNIHRGRDPDNVNLALISDSAARIVRMEITWIDVERHGQYEFGSYDNTIDALRQHGKSIILGLAYGHPDHSDGPANAVFALPPNTPEQRAAYGRFVQAVAKRYHGSDIVYEIWNEPNLDLFWPPTFDAKAYGELLGVAARAIRDVEPDATIIPAGLANENDPAQFLHTLASAGALRDVDGISFHPYRQDGPENSLFDIAEFESAAVGRPDQPLWITEWGYSEAWLAKGGPDSRQRQAVMIGRMMLTAALARAKALLVYDLIDDGTDPHDQESSFGLYDYDFNPKVSAMAFRTIADLMSGCSTYEFKADGARHTITAAFHIGTGVSFVIWTYEPGRPLEICFTTPDTHPVELTDISGNHLPLETCGSPSQIRLALSEVVGPVILHAENNKSQ